MNWLRQLLELLLKTLPPPKPDPPPGPPPGGTVGLLLELHNVERQKYGLSSLQANQALEKAAQSHALWMSEHKSLTHFPPQGGPSDRVKAFGYTGPVGENIAWNYTNERDVFDGWMRSSGHRANILGSRWVNVGFGVADASPGDPSDKYWCVIFG